MRFGGRRRGDLSTHFRWLAERLDAGHRETPQRFRPLALRLMRPGPDRERIWRLFDFILRDQASEFRVDAALPYPVLPEAECALVERMRLAVEEAFDAGFWREMDGVCRGMAPLRRRRRSVHCHGVIAPSRALLVMRTICSIVLSFLDPAEGYGENSPCMSRELELLLAYHVSGYAHDHFEMIGPAVAWRMRGVALWCQANARDDGFNPRGRMAAGG